MGLQNLHVLALQNMFASHTEFSGPRFTPMQSSALLHKGGFPPSCMRQSECCCGMNGWVYINAQHIDSRMYISRVGSEVRGWRVGSISARNGPCLLQREDLVHVNAQLALFLQPGKGSHLVAVGLYKHQLVERAAHQGPGIPRPRKRCQWRSETGCAM